MLFIQNHISKRICASVIFSLSATGSFALDDHAENSSETAMQLRRENRIVYKNQATKLVEQMTLDEKLSLICMSSKKVNRLNIPDHDWWNEALHGVGRNGLATQFPQSISMASTWNPELIERMASAIADEARAKHHEKPDQTGRYQGLTIWSPTVNLARDPRWGRNEETYGEDPWLTSRMANAFVRGLQGNHPKYLKTVATVKHFIANNTEYNRTQTRPFIAEELLRDYYMIPYKSAVEEADVQSIMTAYNGINDVPCAINARLITDVLRGEWGFTGTVVTDVGAPKFLRTKHKVTLSDEESCAKMIQAGVDVISDNTVFKEHTRKAIEQKLLDEAELDRAIIQNLATRLELGQMNGAQDNPYTTIPSTVVGSDAHRQIARTIAQQGTVLLKNTAGLAPVDSQTFKRVIVAGPYGNIAQLGGYSGTPTINAVTPLAGITTAATAAGMDVINMTALDCFASIPTLNLRPAPGVDGSSGLKGEYFKGTGLEGAPSATRLDPTVNFIWQKPISNIDPLIPQPTFSVRWSGALIPDQDGEHVIAAETDEGVRVWLDDRLIIDQWTNQKLRTLEAEPMALKGGQSYAIRMEYFDTGKKAEAKLLWKTPVEKAAYDFDKESTLLVYVCGFNMHMADEYRDLMELGLPRDQLATLKNLHAVYPHTIVVFNGGTMVAEDWVYENIPTVFHAWYPGQEGGDALADLLFGKVSPSGRSPITFYGSQDHLPDIDDYDLTKGRTYMYQRQKVSFPFGHGLTYTTFEYGKVSLDRNTVTADSPNVTVSVAVKNTGRMAADEVVQLYVKDLAAEARAFNPLKKLGAFERISLKPGESGEVTLTLDARAFQFWDADADAYVIEPGDFEIQVGGSSADIRATATLTILSEK